MNIDFHYGVIYVVSRLAGLGLDDARTVAHACQYVDDSTVPGILEFDGGQTYERFASAHKMLDYKNALNSTDKVVWAPFHFLPAGEGETLEEKSVCRPNSAIAQEMVKHAIEARSAENAYHRLGITLHVYVDTWAHQNFSGTISDHNVVKALKSDDHEPGTWEGKLKVFLKTAKDVAISDLLDLISKLGHGAALHFPDLPWAKWEYTNGHGYQIRRDNLPDFIEAAEMAYRAIKGFQHGNSDFATEDGFPADVKEALIAVLESNRSENEEERLAGISEAFTGGKIPGFVGEDIPLYVGKGAGSWKEAATGIVDDAKDVSSRPIWSESFENSDYRKFHDAIKEHRFVITQKILPRHGVRLA